jgi:hypothetical protein
MDYTESVKVFQISTVDDNQDILVVLAAQADIGHLEDKMEFVLEDIVPEDSPVCNKQ